MVRVTALTHLTPDSPPHQVVQFLTIILLLFVLIMLSSCAPGTGIVTTTPFPVDPTATISPVAVASATPILLSTSTAAVTITPFLNTTSVPLPTETLIPDEESDTDAGSGAKQGGDDGVNPNLPSKSDRNVTPIGGPNGRKQAADEVTAGDPQQLIDEYGDKAKPLIGTDADTEGSIGDVTMIAPPTPLPTEHSLRMFFTVTPTSFTLNTLSRMDGSVAPESLVRGDYLYVVYLEDRPIFYGTFNDPLLAIGIPDAEGTVGHSYTKLSSGTVSLSAPGQLLDVDLLARVHVSIFKVGTTIQFLTPLNLQTLPELIAVSTLVSEVNGDTLVERYNTDLR